MNTTAPGNWNDNSSRSTTDTDVITNGTVQLIFSVLYVSIFVLGVFGNALVCFVVVRNRQMQNVTNLFITNLAISDVLLCVLAVPFTPLYTFLGGWIFGKTLCHLVPYAQGVSVYTSTLTLMSIAIDRFMVIIHPFRPRMKIEVCLTVIFGIWTVALLVTLPYGLYMHLEEPYTYCEEHWPSEQFRKIFSSVTSILQFALPFNVIAFCYTRVSIKLSDRARSKPGTKSNKREEADRERKKRTNRMLIAMVTIFGVSWLPLNIVNVVDDFYPPANDWTYYRLCFFMTHCLAMSSTCYNPFLYAWLNDNFRKEFKQVLPFFPRTVDDHGPTSTEGFRNDKPCSNGNNTLQDSLLPSQAQIRVANLESCELIVLETTATNASRELEDSVTRR
ncbi:PREDICTED: prolactin-releasing peptide receptor-like [Dufourea novaeangliae]|uniref:Prolactin-releasing peptide receptor n=1 Tax=Dufourea novaeangliae TaxID=178035 RepID=A0A154PRA0_DUFNO|nr:PREDICTED: prolactin-releasing peptide receptor-like [Dufourea novaeangliae]KZC13640.1 Prolactin-releasing peptide receptor [Dufourea novaeangliae]